MDHHLNLTVVAYNSFGYDSAPASVPINVYFVNSPPVANAETISDWADDGIIHSQLNASDPDGNLTTARFLTLPGQGRLYYSTTGDWPTATPVSAEANSFSFGGAGGGGLFFFLPNSYTNGTPCIPDPNDYGSPYATFTYSVTDTYGLSATNTVTVNILPPREPFPVPSGSETFTCLTNSPVNIALIATNQDGSPLGSDVTFSIDSLPIHGQLSMQGFPILSVPVQLAAADLHMLYYTPNAGYYTSRDGPDGFAFHTSDTYDAMNCTSNATLVVIAPPSLQVTQLVNQTFQTGPFVGTLAPRDANTNALLQLNITGVPAGTAPYGYFAFSTNGLVNVQTDLPGAVQFEGTAAAINAVLTNGIEYTSTYSSYATNLVFTLNDQGATGFGTNLISVTVPAVSLHQLPPPSPP